MDAPRGFGHPVSAASFDAAYREGQWALLDSAEEKSRYVAIADLIRQHGTRHPHVLDAGCGSGRLASEFSPGELGVYHGVDLSPEALRLARLAIPAPAVFTQGDLETWQPTERFDIIVINEVVGYFHDPAKTLARLSRALQPGGAIIVSLYRWGNSVAIWRRIEARFTVLQRTTTTNQLSDKHWDIRLLQPFSRLLPYASQFL